MNDNQYFEVSANDFIEQQTRNIEREFRCSRPSPRNRAMGFKGDGSKKSRRILTYYQLLPLFLHKN